MEKLIGKGICTRCEGTGQVGIVACIDQFVNGRFSKIINRPMHVSYLKAKEEIENNKDLSIQMFRPIILQWLTKTTCPNCNGTGSYYKIFEISDKCKENKT